MDIDKKRLSERFPKCRFGFYYNFSSPLRASIENAVAPFPGISKEPEIIFISFWLRPMYIPSASVSVCQRIPSAPIPHKSE
uniref:Uncharacterized protein n=1 Tax=mine drainage metagenome TaxID=410659 RepID=E6Q305_9ZZZZ